MNSYILTFNLYMTTIEKRITFTASDDFVKSVKAYALSNGTTVKTVMIDCFNKVVSKDDLNNNEYIPENEADKMLKPLIKKYVNQIKSNTLKGTTLKEIKAECLSDK